MADMKGLLKVKAGGKEYSLFLGMSVLASLQDEHGKDVLQQLEPPDGATAEWMPDLNIVHDIFFGALERYHSDVADRWLVDDIFAENLSALDALMASAFPDAKEGGVGKPKKPKKAA